MNLKNLMAKFYLDKEKDIVVKLFKSNEDELTYIIETPNHHTKSYIDYIWELLQSAVQCYGLCPDAITIR